MGSWRGFVIPGRSQPNSLKMKVLLVLAVAAAVSAHSGEDYKMFMKWAKGKAMESCWGEDNMKLLTLNMKKPVSKCMQEDAPELDLPPFRYMNVHQQPGQHGQQQEPGPGPLQDDEVHDDDEDDAAVWQRQHGHVRYVLQDVQLQQVRQVQQARQPRQQLQVL